MELKERGKEVYRVAKNELKRLGIWRDDKVVILKMYAQSVDDWENAVEEARENGEINHLKNGANQPSAYHTIKKDYGVKVRVLRKELFTVKELEKVEKPKKKGTKDITDL